MKKTLETYSVTAKLELIVSVDIKAENLTDALLSSGKLDEHDFVKILGEYFDGGCEIVSVTYNDGYKLKRDE